MEPKKIQKHPGLVAEQKWTQPPNRFSVASLGKECENKQIARPATFSNFLEVLQNRKYITKNKNSFQATELGMKVTDFLVEADFCFVNVQFTAEMEDLLDEVQNATKDKVDLLTEFWTRLKKDIENGKSIKKKQEVTEYDCPKCKGKLLLKHSKFGPFYSCENYKPPKKVKGEKVEQPDSCGFIGKVGEHGEPIEKVVKPKEYAKFACKKCGSKMVKRTSQYGVFFGCSQFPSCRAVADEQGTFKEPKKYKKKWNKKKG